MTQLNHIHNITARDRTKRLLTAGSTVSSFTNPVSTSTLPVTVNASIGILPVARNLVVLNPFGLGNDDQTFVTRIFGWTPGEDLYVPSFLLEITCTLSTQVGVAGSADVIETERLCDTIVAAPTITGVDTSKIVSPGNNVPGHLLLDCLGFQYLGFYFDMTGATNGNFLYRFI